MSRLQPILRAALAAALLAAPPARAVPPQVMTYSGTLKTSGGAAVTSPTNITFRLYTASSGGPSVWSETVSVTPTGDGWFSAVIGTTTPLPFGILNQDLYLSLQVGADVEFAQRARVTPSHAALTVDWGGVQGKPSCTAGAYLTLDVSGGLTCTIPATGGTGGVSSVTASSPINALTTGGTVQLSMSAATTTTPGYLASADFTAFANKLTPPSGCTAGQAIVSQAGAWVCSSVSGTVGVASPLQNTGTASAPVVALPTCGIGEVLKYTGAAPSTWTCQPDAAGGSGTVTAIATGAGLVGGAPSAITGAGTVAIDTAVVPQLGAATNTFSGTVAAATFSGSGSGLTGLDAGNLGSGTVPAARVAGAYGGITGVGTLTGLAVSGDADLGNNALRRAAPAVALITPAYVNTVDTVVGGTITKGDGFLYLTTTAATAATLDVRTTAGGMAWGIPMTGSYLAARVNGSGLGHADHTAYVFFGSPAGVGSNAGGFGFRLTGGATTTAVGMTVGGGGIIAGQTASVTLNGGFNSVFAIHRGSTVEFFVNGASIGTATTSGMTTLIFTPYAVRLEQSAAAGAAWMGVSHLTLGVPVY